MSTNLRLKLHENIMNSVKQNKVIKLNIQANEAVTQVKKIEEEGDRHIKREDVLKGKEALIEKIPRLIPEEFVKRCKGCVKQFGVCTWKHHCRVCGFIFCFYCANNFDNFLPFYLEVVRMCNDCFYTHKNKYYICE